MRAVPLSLFTTFISREKVPYSLLLVLSKSLSPVLSMSPVSKRSSTRSASSKSKNKKLKVDAKARKAVNRNCNNDGDDDDDDDEKSKKLTKKESDKEPWYSFFTKGDEQYNQYMANEWSQELRGDAALFEKLTLEGAQSGLSWLTILRKREAYRKTFHGFDIDKVAAMTLDSDVQAILDQDTANTSDMIVRHRGKIQATITNAQKIQEMIQKDGPGSFDSFLWKFVDDKPILNVAWNTAELRVVNSSVPTQTPESQDMSKSLKKLGFRFVGPTTCYALMQSAGMVIDHPVDSPEWQISKQRLKDRPLGFQER